MRERTYLPNDDPTAIEMVVRWADGSWCRLELDPERLGDEERRLVTRWLNDADFARLVHRHSLSDSERATFLGWLRRLPVLHRRRQAA